VQSTKLFFAGSIVDAGDCVVTVDAVRASLRREELTPTVLTLCGETVVPISNLKSIKMKPNTKNESYTRGTGPRSARQRRRAAY
jgi:hypothetical protein